MALEFDITLTLTVEELKTLAALVHHNLGGDHSSRPGLQNKIVKLLNDKTDIYGYQLSKARFTGSGCDAMAQQQEAELENELENELPF